MYHLHHLIHQLTWIFLAAAYLPCLALRDGASLASLREASDASLYLAGVIPRWCLATLASCIIGRCWFADLPRASCLALAYLATLTSLRLPYHTIPYLAGASLSAYLATREANPQTSAEGLHPLRGCTAWQAR